MWYFRASASLLLFVLVGCSTVPYQDATASLDKGLAATQSSLSALSGRDQTAAAILVDRI